MKSEICFPSSFCSTSMCSDWKGNPSRQTARVIHCSAVWCGNGSWFAMAMVPLTTLQTCMHHIDRNWEIHLNKWFVTWYWYSCTHSKATTFMYTGESYCRLQTWRNWKRISRLKHIDDIAMWLRQFVKCPRVFGYMRYSQDYVQCMYILIIKGVCW